MGVAQGRPQERLGRDWPSLGPSVLLTFGIAAIGFRALAHRMRLWRIVIALVLATATAQAIADVQYAYDPAGRLVQVVAADGSSAVYQYDAAGNILAIQRVAADQLVLVAFNPASGGPGAQVALQGGGFSPTPSANAVSFNGAGATVLAATANQLIVQVPSGATSGPISVTVGSHTVTSTQPFLVNPPPTITSFTPTSGVAGTTITVAGAHLASTVGQTTVTLNGMLIHGASVSDQLITFAVPAGVGSGPIAVTTAYGRATSRKFLAPTTAIAL